MTQRRRPNTASRNHHRYCAPLLTSDAAQPRSAAQASPATSSCSTTPPALPPIHPTTVPRVPESRQRRGSSRRKDAPAERGSQQASASALPADPPGKRGASGDGQRLRSVRGPDGRRRHPRSFLWGSRTALSPGQPRPGLPPRLVPAAPARQGPHERAGADRRRGPCREARVHRRRLRWCRLGAPHSEAGLRSAARPLRTIHETSVGLGATGRRTLLCA